MRKLLRSTPFIQRTRCSAPEYNPEAHDQKFKSWWSRLNNLSSKPSSKVYLAQLANLFAYYNKQVTDNTKVSLTTFSPSTSKLGMTRSSPRDWLKRSKSTTKISPRESMICRKPSTPSSPKTPRPSTKSYFLSDSG